MQEWIVQIPYIVETKYSSTRISIQYLKTFFDFFFFSFICVLFDQIYSIITLTDYLIILYYYIVLIMSNNYFQLVSWRRKIIHLSRITKIWYVLKHRISQNSSNFDDFSTIFVLYYILWWEKYYNIWRLCYIVVFPWVSRWKIWFHTDEVWKVSTYSLRLVVLLYSELSLSTYIYYFFFHSQIDKLNNWLARISG